MFKFVIFSERDLFLQLLNKSMVELVYTHV